MSSSTAALEPHLYSLLPTYSGLLPPQLLSLTSALLSQSRTRISNLKSTEEPARPYVCAHLACERLKHTLDLPTISPRPPLPKKAYESLLAHFRTNLPQAQAKKTEAVQKQKQAEAEVEADLPKRLRGEIVKIVRDLTAPEIEPHVLRGVAAVRAADVGHARDFDDRTIVAAVLLLGIERMCTGGETVGGIVWVRNQGYVEKRLEIARVLQIRKTLGTEEMDGAKVDELVKVLSNEGFRKWAWMKEIPNGVGLNVQPEGVEVKKRPGRPQKEAVQVTSTGSPRRKQMAAATPVQRKPAGGKGKSESAAVTRMLQERVDYLSDRKVKSYQEWSRNVLAMCDRIEAVGS